MSANSNTLIFKSDEKIDLIYTSSSCYHNTNKFDKEEAKNRDWWHEVTVHHDAEYCKGDIVKLIFKTIGNTIFYPVKYTVDTYEDRFYVRKCLDALEILFDNKLILKTPPDLPKLHLTIRLRVAKYVKGQIMPEHKIENAIEMQSKKLITHCGVKNVLNLENFMDLIDEEVIIYLGISEIFSVLCDRLSGKHDILNSINGINLSNNHISSLLGIDLLKGATLDVIDLRLNSIRDINQIYKIQCIEVKDLLITGNPIQKETNVLSNIKERFPNLIKLNGIPLNDIRCLTEEFSLDSCEVELNGKLVLVSPDRISDFYITENNNSWHQIKIPHNGSFNKSEIVEAIFKFFVAANNNDPFYICYYKTGEVEDTFLVRNQYFHLKLLMEHKLKLPIKNNCIQLNLLLNAGEYKDEHISEDIIETELRQFYNGGLLNLKQFSSKNLFKNKLIVNINLPQVYGKILVQSFRAFVTIIEIDLSDNCISDGCGLKILKQIETLKLLNLANNNLSHVHDLISIEKIKITNLYLDGNPLCEKYNLSKDYIHDVKLLFPQLLVLDGVELKTEGAVIGKKNYLCNLEAFDLIEQFVGNYFNVFDSENKENLIKMYSKCGIFTLSNYSKYYRRKTICANYSRNLLNGSNNVDNVYAGSNILDILKLLPKFQHDFHSFTTDVHVHKPNLVILTITGVLKILASSITEPDTLFSFSRNLILQKQESTTSIGIFNSTSEYVITNDQLALNDPVREQEQKSFRFQNPETNYSVQAIQPEDKTAFLLMFQQLTGLKTAWCTRFLDEGEYDFQKSLEIFMNCLKDKEIPITSFLNK